MKKEGWYTLLCLINAVIITICTSYIQTTLYSSFRAVDGRFSEMEHKLSHLTTLKNASKWEEMEGGNNEEGKEEEKRVEWEKYNPIKDNRRSFYTNAHKVMKSNPDIHTYDGEYTNSFLRTFVQQYYNFTINTFDRVDLYYLSDVHTNYMNKNKNSKEAYPSGFSYFMDVIVDKYYESIFREDLNAYMKEKIEGIRECRRRE